jgi:hypothetical protein
MVIFIGRKMKNFLNSRYVSLACAGINGTFAISSLASGSWIWAFICGTLTAYCFNNYLKG